MTPDTNKERAAFEAHYFAENGNRLYCESQWRGWKARAAKAPAAEPVAYIVRSVKRPSERGMVIHADKAGSYQRATLSLEPIYTAPPQGAAKGE
jgi:hypothetical protein